jgi:hypothetical protein
VTPHPDAASSDAAATRSPLCGMVGCYPGNLSACGATPPADAGAWARAQLSDAGEPDDANGADALPPPADDATNIDSESPEASFFEASTYDAAASDAAIDATPVKDASPRDASSSDASYDAKAEGSTASDGSTRDASAESSSVLADTGANDEPKAPMSCYVRPSTPNTGSSVIAECAPAGQVAAGSACQDSTDCAASLACVDVDGSAVCRRFSCALPPQCPTGSYYQLKPLRVQGVTMPSLKVPVCLPVDHCQLLATPSTCPNDQICAVVGSEGDTTCVAPGTAQLGEACDDLDLCAEGLVCSKLKGQCLKLCRVASGMAECPGGTCQGGNRSLPDGFGICVGTNLDGG